MRKVCIVPVLHLLGLLTCVGGLVHLHQSTALAARIEADPGKIYHLKKKHGPWMIKVASFSGETPDQRENASDAANQLVLILRRKNIPAYIFRQDEQIEELETYDTKNRLRKRHYTAQHGEIAVLAGNYDSVEDKVAQQTLKHIKKMTPKVEVKQHGEPVSYPLALNKAFLAPNPILPADELRRRSRDPLIAQLNSGIRNSLLENKGKYTLVVASFHGNAAIKPATFASFERDLLNKEKISLDNAAENATQLATVMRNQHQLDTYVYHDRFKSIVTVGAFDSPADPLIANLIERFRAKDEIHPQTKQKVLVGQAIHLVGRDPKNPLKSWILDPEPELVEVPRH